MAKQENYKLLLLLRFVELAAILIFCSIVFTISRSAPYIGKFSNFSSSLPDNEKFDQLKSFFGIIAYVVILKAIVIRGFSIAILLIFRNIIRSILKGGVFQREHENKIRKIAVLFLCFAAILLIINFSWMLLALNRGHIPFMKALGDFIGIFERYLLPALIAFAITEIFIAGMQLKKENELTI